MHENTQKAAQRHIDIQPKEDYFQTPVICKFCENGSLPTLNTNKLFHSSVCHLASQHMKQIREEFLDFIFSVKVAQQKICSPEGIATDQELSN